MESSLKFLAIFVGLVLVIGTLSTATSSIGESDDTEIVLVSLDGENDVSRINSADGEILERYPDKVLVEIHEKDILELERDGYVVESLANRGYIGLQSHSFDTGEGTPEIPEDLEIDSYSEDETGYYIVQFIGPIRTEWQEELEREGAELHEFRHRFNFIVEMDQEIKRRVEEKDFVNWVGVYEPAYRLDNDLLEDTGEQLIEMSFFDGIDLRESAIEVEELGGELHAVGRNSITIDIHTQRIENLANLRGVRSISEGMEEPELYNDDATWITQTNIQDDRKVTEEGVTGTDQLLTVCDSELYSDHEAFEDDVDYGDDHRKIQDHYSIGGDLYDGEYHGTHVAGTVLGESPPYGEYSNHDGNALESRMIFQDIGTSDGGLSVPDDMYADAWQPSYDSGSRAHTNSWGGGIQSYTGLAIEGDEFIWDHKDYNILFAMGNDGPGAETMSGEPEGKNFFSVGGVTNYPDHNTMASFSSRGYADDGRIKPTVLHVAENVDSADRSATGYDSMSGTSMSTPGIAGQIGQVREYYEEGYHIDGTANPAEGFNPSNALVRATIINGAAEITGDGAYNNDNRFPNNDQGFGNSRLDRALSFEGDDRNSIVYDSWDEGEELDTGETWETEFQVDDPDQELEVTLAWTDYPGSDGSDESDPAIVNDLDLEVDAPDGTRYVGNAFTDYNPGYSEADPADNPWDGLRDGEFDGLNVEENVLLLPDENGVEEGTYEVTVSAHQVPEGTQPFALVVSGGVVDSGPTVDVTNPQGGETWEFGDTETIQWDTEEDENPIDSVDIEYSVDGGNTYNTIASGIDDTGSYEWEIPDETSSESVVSVTAHDTEDLSGSDTSDAFTLLGSPPAPPENLDVELYGQAMGTLFEDDVSEDKGYETTGDENTWDIRDYGSTEGDQSWDWGDAEYEKVGELSSLISPEIEIPEDVDEEEPVTLTFDHWRDIDNEWDGLNLKVSTNGEDFELVEDPDPGYDYEMNTGYDNPIEGEPAWGGSVDWEEVTVNLDDYAGETIQLRWDAGVEDWDADGGEGWRIDNIHIEGLIADEDGDDHNLVSWDASEDDPDGVSHYNLYRAEEEDGEYEEIATVDADGSANYEYLDEDKGAADDTLWWYTVEAEDDAEQVSEEGPVQEPGEDDEEEVDSIEINTDTEVIVEGDQADYTATAYDENDEEIGDVTSETTWSIDEDAGGEWDQENGIYTSENPGEWTVTGEYEDEVDESTLTVEPEDTEVSEVVIYPEADQVVDAGEELEFDAEALDEDGQVIEDDPTEFSWQNAEDGVFYETETGDYDVTATYDGVVSDPTIVTVEPAEAQSVEISPQTAEIEAGGSQVYTATATDEWGNEFDVTGETIWSDDIDDSEWTDNEVTAYSSGDWTVTGEYENDEGTILSDTGSLTVEPGEVDDVVIYPEEDQVVDAGEELEFDAEAYDVYGNLITDHVDDFDWQNAPNGHFYETETGEYDVTATYDGMTSPITVVTVEAGEPDYIEIEPQEETVNAGESVTYYSTAFDEHGNEVEDVTDETGWSIEDGAGGEWDENVYTSENDGEWTVTGTYNYDGEDLVDQALLEVVVTDVDDVVLTPDEPQTIIAGERMIFEAEAYDEGGTLVTDDRMDFDWETATRGVFNRRRAGDYEVTASYDGVTSDPVIVTVEPAEADRIEISPEEETVEAGTTLTYTATAYDEYENEIGEVSGETSWSIEDGAGGSWTGNEYTSEVVGDWTVTGDHDGLNDTALLTVEPGAVDTVELTPSEDQTIVSGEKLEFSAEAYDAYGNLIADNVEAFEWENAARGVFYHETPGEYEVTATLNGVTSEPTTVTVEEDDTENEVDLVDDRSLENDGSSFEGSSIKTDRLMKS